MSTHEVRFSPEEVGKQTKKEILERAKSLTQWPTITVSNNINGIFESKELEGITLREEKYRESFPGSRRFVRVSPKIALLKDGIYEVTPEARAEIKFEDYSKYHKLAISEIEFWENRFARLARRT